MKTTRMFVMAGVSMLALSSPAFAADGPVTDKAAASAPSDIVVSARRKDERLQDVPKVVSVVTGGDLNKLNIRQFQDVQAVAPGLNLQPAETGYTQKTTMRGVSFDVNAGADATVDFYLNDSSIQQGYLFRSLYDIGQIEVLRGPQGTLRGHATPSGSITVTTHQPDLYRWGGYVDGTGGLSSDMANNVQGAINIPVIPGKLAIRLAAQFDDNDGNFVHPAHIAGQSPLTDNPYNRTWSQRASVRFEPTDTLQFNVTYQHMVEHLLNYSQTASTCVLTNTTCPDPAYSPTGTLVGSYTTIYPSQRLSTYNGANTFAEDFDIINGKADWHFKGQKLSYVGSYAVGTFLTYSPMDPGNIFGTSGAGVVQSTNSRNQYQSHEVRLASEERIVHIFDYTLGFFNIATPTQNLVIYNALGSAAQQTVVPNSGNRRETSIFGNITVHPTEKLEISGGLRKIIASGNTSNTEGFLSSSARWLPTIWTASASYHITPAVMVYASAGTSARQGTTSVGPVLSPGQNHVYVVDPQILQFADLQAEYSHSYEIGLKSQFNDRAGTFNITYFHQNFSNFQYANAGNINISGVVDQTATYQGQTVPVFPITPVTPLTYATTSTSGMGANVPVKVDGVEGDVGYRFSSDLNLGMSFSYVHSQITGGKIPCNSGGTNLLDANGHAVVMVCNASGPATFTPALTATLRGEYSHAVSPKATGYLRGLLSVYGATAYNPDVPLNKQQAYALLNTYVGVRSSDGSWDLSLFVKNVTNTQTILQSSAGNTQAVSNTQYGAFGGPYYTIAYTPPRTVGVNLRYAFGSR